MNNIYDNLIELAKSIHSQNLFTAAKEINGIRLFKNIFDFSRLQEIYLSYLYTFDTINQDMVIDKISEHVLDDKIYWDAYMLWKRKHTNKTENKDNNKKDLKLIPGKTIKFPKGS